MSRPLQDKTIIVTGGFGALGARIGPSVRSSEMRADAEIARVRGCEFPAVRGRRVRLQPVKR